MQRDCRRWIVAVVLLGAVVAVGLVAEVVSTGSLVIVYAVGCIIGSCCSWRQRSVVVVVG